MNASMSRCVCVCGGFEQKELCRSRVVEKKGLYGVHVERSAMHIGH